MARGKKKAKELTPEEKLAQALVPVEEHPYQVPENWCWVRLEQATEVLNGFAFKSKKYVDNGIRIIRIANVQDGYIEDDKPVFYPIDAETNIQKFILKAGDLLISLTGNVGRVALLSAELLPAALNQRVGCLRLNSFTVKKEFLYYYFLRKEFQSSCTKNAKGTAQLNMSTEWLKLQPIPIAPLSEQKRIVDRIKSIFSKLDEAKERAQEVVDGFEMRKSAILYKAFTGELTKKWREEQRVIFENWEQVVLSDICKINPKKLDTRNLPDDLEVSFFPMPALSEIYGEITDPQIRTLKEVRTGFTNFSEGDIVFAKITPCMENGKSAVIGKLVNDIGFGTTEFFVLRCGNKLYNRYLYYLVRDQHFRDKAKTVMTGAVGQQRVPKSFLEEYQIQLPSVAEQKEIIRILDDLFAKEMKVKEASEAVIEQIDVMKKAVLARAFRGELGTNDPKEESAVELLKSVINL